MPAAALNVAFGARPLVSEATAIACYVDAGASALGRRARRVSVAGYRARFTNLTGWGGAAPEDRLSAVVTTRTVAAFLVTATGYPAEADYVRRSGNEWGLYAAAAHPRCARDFHAAATGIGFSDHEARQQWRALAKITATTSVAPGLLDGVRFSLAADALTADRRADRQPHRRCPHSRRPRQDGTPPPIRSHSP